MDNYAIADQFSLLSKLMDIHGENSFKSKSYAIAAYTIEQLPAPLSETPGEKIFGIKGIGESTGKKILEIMDKGELLQLKELLQKTPPGVLEMLTIKGLGPKKIATIWKEMEIESVGELLYACNENRLLLFKGFGEKTQKGVQESIQFYFKHQGSFLYSETEGYAQTMDSKLKETINGEQFALTGEFKRQMEVINTLEWITTASTEKLKNFFSDHEYEMEDSPGNIISFKGTGGIRLAFHITEKDNWIQQLVETSCGDEFLQALRSKTKGLQAMAHDSEESFFSTIKVPFIPPALRETASIMEQSSIPELIQLSDIKGIIHSHSNWSDGVNTIEEMAKGCIDRGLEYLVISDHSKSAVYAKGLTEDRIKQQHLYIDELNEQLKPFKIFKSIECDILTDGRLDYSDNILSTFDLVITSVHSNFKMNEDKATGRLIAAIENPYTTILGHMTGRLLLSRNGYPLNTKRIIEACVANKVVIEHNSHPRRLDMDWRWISYALEQGVLISIDPDAHSVRGFDDIKFGVLSAQKGGLTAKQNLSSFTLQQVENYLQEKRTFSKNKIRTSTF